jgi:aldehyde dehydrogenase (NAD+)
MKKIITDVGLSPRNFGAFGRGAGSSSGEVFTVVSPVNNETMAEVVSATPEEYEKVVAASVEVFAEWRNVPAPERGGIVREMGNAIRDSKHALGKLVTAEMGKILSEGEGEIQEAVDIADFAVGLSRQLCGQTMHSERRLHRMYEQWHPVGPVGVITAFNFPAAVWAWNSMIAAVCGDTVVWKPSELTPLTAIALNSLCREVLKKYGFEGVFSLVVGKDSSLGERLAADIRIPLISATGSCRMGRSVAKTVAGRFGRSILELGGNNSVIVMEDADSKLVVSGLLFGAVGTAGQRCTTVRRVLIHRSRYDEIVTKLIDAYKQVRIGNPLEPGVLMGPLSSAAGVAAYSNALKRVPGEGGTILYGGDVVAGMPSDKYVLPTIVKAVPGMPLMNEETFAPILYLLPVDSLDEAIAINNSVPQGLSSAIFTNNLRYSERFLSHSGSDCGIANVNIGTSGAEIGGAFGGEKETGGGREAGSDAWKQYMRRQTSTINYGDKMPLAQGVVFG